MFFMIFKLLNNFDKREFNKNENIIKMRFIITIYKFVYTKVILKRKFFFVLNEECLYLFKECIKCR